MTYTVRITNTPTVWGRVWGVVALVVLGIVMTSCGEVCRADEPSKEWVRVERITHDITNKIPAMNVERGAALEQGFDIQDNLDGEWDCRDRAEIVNREAHFAGLSAMTMREQITPTYSHRWVMVFDNEGAMHAVYRIDKQMVEKQELRRGVR